MLVGAADALGSRSSSLLIARRDPIGWDHSTCASIISEKLCERTRISMMVGR
jgi:hypothetical protein